MSMFDYVNFKIYCPVCGKLVDKFQTKSLKNQCEHVDFEECDNFYSWCNFCHSEINFKLLCGDLPITLDSFGMRIFPNEFEEKCFLRNLEGRIVGIRGAGFTESEREAAKNDIS